MVTSAAYRKQPYFNTPERLDFLEAKLAEALRTRGWSLQAWAVMSNHYHFIAMSPEAPDDLAVVVRRIHSESAREVNRLDNAPGRRVWFQYWDSHLTFPKSYFARLNYVHQNPVHHGLVRVATAYRWCSAGWFERNAEPAFCRMITSFRCDRVNVPDDF
jgi:putative transposase